MKSKRNENKKERVRETHQMLMATRHLPEKEAIAKLAELIRERRARDAKRDDYPETDR